MRYLAAIILGVVLSLFISRPPLAIAALTTPKTDVITLNECPSVPYDGVTTPAEIAKFAQADVLEVET